MAAHTPRIEELRRRVERDPASIAFAQLAEEHRRMADFDEAVRVCRLGLARHPAYLSARVTLGRALIELRQFDAAKTELEYVLHAAPDHLAAVRALADLRERQGAPDALADIELPPAAADRPPLDLKDLRVPGDPALVELECWLESIMADRRARQ